MSNNITPPTSEKEPLITGKFLPEEWLTEAPPEHEFCVNPLLPIGAVTLINAHGGTGKSIFALKMAVHITLGLPIVSAETNGGKVAYMSLEDPENVVRGRIFNIVRMLSPDVHERIGELTSKLMIIDRYGLQTHMAINGVGNIVTAPIAHALSGLLKDEGIKCIFVDTFIRTNTLNENDNAQMGALLVAFEQIAKEVGCAVVLIHHLPKGSENKAYAARGASAITDNARSAILLEIVSEKGADKFSETHIKAAALAKKLIKVTHTKHNYSAEHPEQYLVMENGGILVEAFATAECRSAHEQRYQEIYAWYESEWDCKPLTKTNIEQNITRIRPANANYGKEKYKEALNWAVSEGYAKQVPAPVGGSRNSQATYYTLSSMEKE